MQDTYRPTDPVEAEIDAIGGEALADSGFEIEEPEPEFDDAVQETEG